MGRVESAFEEYKDRRDGLIEALSSNLDALLMEGKKVKEHTPYEERKCLWGLKGKNWELKQATYPFFGESPHPQPLVHFDESAMSLTEWINLTCDYSDAWLVGFMAYTSMSFSLEERRELMEKIQEFPCLKDVINRVT